MTESLPNLDGLFRASAIAVELLFAEGAVPADVFSVIAAVFGEPFLEQIELAARGDIRAGGVGFSPDGADRGGGGSDRLAVGDGRWRVD
jgi:hypothetical protein